MRQRRIDPTTMDYVLTSGEPELDPSAASEVVLRLATSRGSVPLPGLESFGSRLRTIDRNAAGSDRRAVAFALEALQPMVDRGAIRSLEVAATVQSERGVGAALLLEVTWRDASGSQDGLQFSLPVGGAT